MGYVCTNCPENHLAGDGEGCEADKATVEKSSATEATYSPIDWGVELSKMAKDSKANEPFFSDLAAISHDRRHWKCNENCDGKPDAEDYYVGTSIIEALRLKGYKIVALDGSKVGWP